MKGTCQVMRVEFRSNGGACIVLDRRSYCGAWILLDRRSNCGAWIVLDRRRLCHTVAVDGGEVCGDFWW